MRRQPSPPSRHLDIEIESQTAKLVQLHLTAILNNQRFIFNFFEHFRDAFVALDGPASSVHRERAMSNSVSIDEPTPFPSSMRISRLVKTGSCRSPASDVKVTTFNRLISSFVTAAAGAATLGFNRAVHGSSTHESRKVPSSSREARERLAEFHLILGILMMRRTSRLHRPLVKEQNS
jgi:hypothetical protein